MTRWVVDGRFAAAGKIDKRKISENGFYDAGAWDFHWISFLLSDYLSARLMMMPRASFILFSNKLLRRMNGDEISSRRLIAI